MEEMAAIFGAMGFRVGEGLDIQTDWYNFGALSIPAHHPARAEHDTFYLPGERDGRVGFCALRIRRSLVRERESRRHGAKRAARSAFAWPGRIRTRGIQCEASRP